MVAKRIASSLRWRLNARLHRLAKRMPPGAFWDRIYHETLFYRCHGRYPKKHMRFNDFLHQMKVDGTLSDPLRVFVTDKELSKIYVAGTVGRQYAVPTLAVLKTASEIEDFEFPNECFIKATNSCGKNIHKKPGQEVDRDLLKSWLRSCYYREGRESNYKGLIPKIILEPIIFNGASFDEYQVFCYFGKPRIIAIKNMDRDSVKKVNFRTFYDSEWSKLPFYQGYPACPEAIDNPDCLSELLEVSAKLSAPFEFVRCDYFSDGKEIIVGEITNCHAGGTRSFSTDLGEEHFSDLLFQ